MCIPSKCTYMRPNMCTYVSIYMHTKCAPGSKRSPSPTPPLSACHSTPRSRLRARAAAGCREQLSTFSTPLRKPLPQFLAANIQRQRQSVPLLPCPSTPPHYRRLCYHFASFYSHHRPFRCYPTRSRQSWYHCRCSVTSPLLLAARPRHPPASPYGLHGA